VPELLNCPQCNKIFVKSFRDICPDCYKEEEDAFETVYQFVRKKDNRMASIEEVEKATGVDEDLIYKFIKQGRISLRSFPNLGYPCESCGTMIREGRICIHCKGNITNGIDRLEAEKRFLERKQREENSKYTTYQTLKLDKK
jgi:flagellar operon protein (TIGR03826 family)